MNEPTTQRLVEEALSYAQNCESDVAASVIRRLATRLSEQDAAIAAKDGALEALVGWDKQWPKGRIHSATRQRECEQQLESAFDMARTALAYGPKSELGERVKELQTQNSSLWAAEERLRGDLDAKIVELGFEQEHRAQAEAERDAAKANVRKYATEVQELADLIIGGQCVPAPFREVKERLIDLLAALASAKRDGERLDWLEKHPLEIGWRQGNGQDFFVFIRRPLGDPEVNMRTFRAAIDAAMSQSSAGMGGGQ